MISARQIEVLELQLSEVLAQWACELNAWGWPAELPEPEAPRDYHRGVRTAIVEWIERLVGRRLISRVWNERMPDEVFESFWRGDGERRVAGSPYMVWTEREVAEMVAQFQAWRAEVLAADVVLEDALDADEVG